MLDLTKLILHSDYPAFKQNAIYTGTCTISGSTAAGANTKTFTVTLDAVPDMVDIMFNGPTDTVHSLDPRPSNGWFRQGRVWVPTNNAGGGNASAWQVYGTMTNSTTLTITAVYIQQFTTAETLTSTDFSYRVIDYSVF